MNDNFNQAIATILNPIKSNGLEMTQMMMQYLLSLRKMDADAKKQKLEELIKAREKLVNVQDEISKLINTKLDENLNFRFREIGKQRAELLTSSVMELANERIKTGLGYDKTMLMNSPTYYKVLALKNDRTIENAAKLSKSYNESDEELKKGIYYGINDIIGKSYIDYYTSSPTQYQRFLDQLNFKYFYESEPIAEYKKQGTKDDLAKYFSGLGSIEKVSIYNKGYGYDTIPTIIVKSQKGTGAILIADSENIGQIESIEIIDPFIDSVGMMVSSVNSLNGTGAIIDAVSKSVFLERPSWKSLEGTLGINSTLLDSYYYQQFSYTIYSPITRSNYDSLVDEWVHPSGFVRFSILDISYSNDLNQNGFIDTFYLTTIKVIEGIIGVYMINFESNGYSSIAPSILPLTKYQTSQDKSLLINPLSNLNWFKESINNFKFLASEWDNFICGDIPSNTYPGRKKINDNSILMNQTLDAQINIITI